MSSTAGALLSASGKGTDGVKNDELKKQNNNNKSYNGDEVREDNVKDDEGDDSKLVEGLDLASQLSLKDQHKGDDSLRRWKEQLLGSVDMSSSVGECKDTEVKVVSMSIVSKGRPDMVVKMPFSKKSLFTLKEGSHYQIKLSFTVSNSIASGLTYAYTVWKTGIRVEHTKRMLGTYSPREEPYVYEFEEDTTPSGIFVRGSYSVRSKIVDDEGKCHLDVSYTFEIQKNWPSPSLFFN